MHNEAEHVIDRTVDEGEQSQPDERLWSGTKLDMMGDAGVRGDQTHKLIRVVTGCEVKPKERKMSLL